MNADELIDYALGRLDQSECERLEQSLRSDPGLATRAQQVHARIRRLLDDGRNPAPPPGLARRTVRMARQARPRSRSILDYVPVRVPFHWADLAVAATIFIAGALTLLPAIQRSRERMNQAGCVFNLQQIGNSLAQYAALHPFYPFPPHEHADAHTGTFAAVLHDAGMLPDLSVLDCPFNGPCPYRNNDLPSFEQVDHIRRTDPNTYRRMLCWDYAYHVGYRHGNAGHGPLHSRPHMPVPVVADQPAHDNYLRILEGNSPNHGRRGQNVLFSDGSVHWLPTRMVSPRDKDLYLNNENQFQPGIDEEDSVLMPSKSSFQGELNR